MSSHTKDTDIVWLLPEPFASMTVDEIIEQNKKAVENMQAYLQEDAGIDEPVTFGRFLADVVAGSGRGYWQAKIEAADE